MSISEKGCVPGRIPCKLYAGDTPTLTIDSIVICQTRAGDLRTFVHGMHPGMCTLKVYNTTLWLDLQ
jgi:hypothetical protein